MNKITLLIHPFFFTRWFVTIEFNKRDNGYDGQTLNPELANKIAQRFPLGAQNVLDKYRRGVEWARDGLLLVYKATEFPPPLNFEHQLFDYIRKTVPSHQVHYYISPDDPREDDNDEDGKKVTDFLVQKLGSFEAIKDAELYAFGEDIGGCVTGNAIRIKRRYEITKNPVILVDYSSHSPHFTLETRIAEGKIYCPQAVFQ